MGLPLSDMQQSRFQDNHNHAQLIAMSHRGYQRLRAHSVSDDEEVVDVVVESRPSSVTRSYSRRAKWTLFISLGLAAYIYALDGTTTYTYLSYATSEFGGHRLLGLIQVVQGIIIAVGKPVIAKLADVRSRGTAYCAVLFFYVLGYTVIATAQNIQAVATGIILYAIGYTGLQLLTQIVIADITTLKWRGLVMSLNTLPFLINAFVGSIISATVIEHFGWRWGYGMFIILIPLGLSPLIATLLWSERITRRNRRSGAMQPEKGYIQSIVDTAEELDAVGLLLIGLSISLTLLPLSLAKNTTRGLNAAAMLAVFLLGISLIPIFCIWDFKWAKYPVIPYRFVRNRTVIGASLIGAFDFMAYSLTFTYLYSFVVVVKDWKLINTTYFMQTQTITLTISGILTGVYLNVFQRYKTLLIFGLVLRVIGAALMLRSRGTGGSNFELLLAQILQGLGGGIAGLCIQVSAQASVTQEDVAMVTAVVLLITEFGAAGGGAIAGAIWSSQMPDKLAEHLPFLSQVERDILFGSITAAAGKPRGDPVREGVIAAYSDVMQTMVIVATVVNVLAVFVAFIMPNWQLGNVKTAVEDESPEEDSS